jgi:hypothetical protein
MQSTETPLNPENLEWWERNGTVIVACKACGYEGEAPWDAEHGESGEWPCLQCGRRWPFLDFDRLWLTPGRSVRYSGCIDLLAHADFPAVALPLRCIARVWRQCDDDPSPFFLKSDPERGEGDDFGWGLRRYASDRLPSLNLAFAILYDFYGWLSWADAEIAFEPYSRKRWAQEHAPAFLAQAIVHLPTGMPWTIGDADMQSALCRIVPRSVPSL